MNLTTPTSGLICHVAANTLLCSMHVSNTKFLSSHSEDIQGVPKFQNGLRDTLQSMTL